MSDIILDDWAESDRARRKTESKFTTFFNRSTQSLSLVRTKSKEGRSRTTVLTKEAKENDSSLQTMVEATHVSPSRLPMLTNPHDKHASLQVTPRPTYTHGTILTVSTSRRSQSPPQSSKPNSQSLPRPQPKRIVTSTSNSKSPASTYSKSSPRSPTRSPVTTGPKAVSRFPTSSTSSTTPQTPSISIPTSSAIVRALTPTSTSSAGKKMFGLLMPTSTTRKPTPTPSTSHDHSRDRPSGHVKWGSLSSRTPLLPVESRESNDSRLVLQPTASETKRASPPHSPTRSSTAKPGDSTPTAKVMWASTDVPRRRSSSKLEFWRSSRTHTPVPDEKGKQNNDVRAGARGEGKVSKPASIPQSTILSPQPRAPATFLPIPRLQRTPPTPQKGGEKATTASVRIDSFLSDSLPLPLPPAESSSSGVGTASATDNMRLTPPKKEIAALTRHPHFAILDSDKELTPRAKSAPANPKGRSSPCLRIPSPKFLHWDKDKDRKERKLKPESVGSPILRDRPLPKARTTKAEKNQLQSQGHTSKKVRRTTHGSFDFERPGSRNSSKSGASEPKSTSMRSDEDLVLFCGRTQALTTSVSVSEMGLIKKDNGAVHGHHRQGLRSVDHSDEIEPVPPLPTFSSRPGHKPPMHRSRKSPSPPRVHSPLLPHSPLYTSASASSTTHGDDADLPRLSSSMGRRSDSRRTHTVHPAFEFEPVGYSNSRSLTHGRSVSTGASSAAYSPPISALTPKPISAVSSSGVNGSGGGLLKLRRKDANTSTRRIENVVDSRTGLIWAPSPLKENTFPDGVHNHGYSGGRARSPIGIAGGRKGKEVNWAEIENGGADMISAKALEEATEVIGALKNALNDAGFLTLQKYVRRFDAQIIPLDGSTGLIARVQRLLDTSAPKADERQKRQLLDSFRKVVSLTS